MKKSTSVSSIVVCLGVVLAILTAALYAQSDAATAKPARWQHMMLTHDATGGVAEQELSRQIIKIGNDGWELVDVEAVSEDGSTTKTLFFFKKPQ